MQQSRAHVRLLIVAGVALLWATAVFGRLGYLQLYRHRDYLLRAQRQQQRIIEISPKRGAIYDRNMHALAMSIKVDSAFAIPNEIKDKPLAAQLLSGVLGLPADLLESRLDSSQNFVWIERKLTPEKSEAITALNLKGVYTQAENKRFYPKADLASHVLGFVDVDEKGLGGIEYALDSQIRGKSEKIVMMADAHQKWFDGAEARRDRGANVVLTLDEKIQYIAERELAAAINKTHALAGTVVVMNPNNGELLAVANWPTFDPNAASAGTPAESRMNRAVSALYEPGSTFKLITLAAAFDQGITNPDEVFDCENGATYVAGHKIHDHKRFGMLTVADILALSSDVGAIKIAERLGAPKFYDYIHAFGFGTPTGVDLPGESRGLLRPLANWSPISIGAISMGQEVGVTPLQLISAVSAIANGGMLYKPHIVAEVRRGDTVLSREGLQVASEPRRVIQPKTAATLRRLMEGVVLNGTGTRARLDGWTSAGKTGSAQKIDPNTGRYSPTQLIASFTGFAPINNPAVAILVSLDSPVGLHEGGMVAAPVFKRVAEQVLPYLEISPDVPGNERLVQAAYKKQTQNDAENLEDFTPSDFSLLPEQPEAVSSSVETHSTSNLNPGSHLTLAVTADEDTEISIPDFSGKTMRDVTEMCLRLGLDPVLVGTNLATEQTPAAGSQVRRGSRITVQFGTPAMKSTAAGNGFKSATPLRVAQPSKVAKKHVRHRH
ncbi:MAG TPA: penicillin-binding transpeptidase domain-containing protein [Verrucomicrobiae bacterium]|jgi:cell division protein FtsI (penicillin-binding protein 3)|nr:penicillin-binding transpeptidase domain-containing protein [Verrucomicrobiae bacterium]